MNTIIEQNNALHCLRTPVPPKGRGGMFSGRLKYIIKNVRNAEWDIMLNGKKLRLEIMSKVINTEYASLLIVLIKIL
jgi:hypothetical protein